MPEVSVIIPVCNTATYLAECLESVYTQTLHDIEIICINDGSTDHSLQILKDFQTRDARIKIIDQENRGVSAARNNGLLIATGKYIGFVDSDDKIAPDYFEILLQLIQHCDLSICGYVGTSEISYIDGVLNIQNVSFNQISNLLDTGLLFSPWGKLYRKEIISAYDIKFLQHLNYGEDLLFNIEYLYKINFINITSKTLYYYNVSNEDSLANKFSIQRFKNTNSQILKVEEFLRNFCTDEKSVKNYIKKKLYWNTYDACFYLLKVFRELNKPERIMWINEIRKFPFFTRPRDYALKPHFLVNLFPLVTPLVYLYLFVRNALISKKK